MIPRGGLRSFFYNGRRYRLTLRRSLLLYHHDSETYGGHADVRGTVSKLKEHVWWPGLDKDAARWVGTCPFCKFDEAQCWPYGSATDGTA